MWLLFILLLEAECRCQEIISTTTTTTTEPPTELHWTDLSFNGFSQEAEAPNNWFCWENNFDFVEAENSDGFILQVLMFDVDIKTEVRGDQAVRGMLETTESQ